MALRFAEPEVKDDLVDEPDIDGSNSLLALLDGKPSTYAQFALDYFEVEFDECDVAHVYAQKPLTADLLKRLQSTRPLEDLAEDIAEIGYASGNP